MTPFLKTQITTKLLELCPGVKLEECTILENGMIDIAGDFINRTPSNITELPVEFRKISGDFIVDWRKLESYKGLPIYVKGKISIKG